MEKQTVYLLLRREKAQLSKGKMDLLYGATYRHLENNLKKRLENMVEAESADLGRMALVAAPTPLRKNIPHQEFPIYVPFYYTVKETQEGLCAFFNGTLAPIFRYSTVRDAEPLESPVLDLFAKLHISKDFQRIGVKYVIDYSENESSTTNQDSRKESLWERFDDEGKKTFLSGMISQLVPIGIFMQELEHGIKSFSSR